ncbi:hypothetical protein AB0D04_18320 [Streptomyces sp. NPDC048483]|uniref:hypothetical protein n=1 Tax=Streptomyces sp. NPDC048483 TaxID=3154927 RepID=UPI00343960F2
MGTTTESTTKDQRTDDETAPEEGAAPETADGTGTEPADAAVPAEGEADGTNDAEEAGRPATEVGAGAGAVVAAGLGLASLTGTWLGTLMSERQKLVGQISLQAGKATDPIAAGFSGPWHMTALVNGIFGLLAVIAATVVLARTRATWVRAVAWGGLALGVLGILIAAGMYLDLFASLPSIPKGPAPGA